MAKHKGKLEEAPGSLIPTKSGLWFDAAQKLHEAENGLREMVAATHRVEYEAGWIRFVESLEEFWTSFFDEGKKTFSTFQPWAGKFITAKKTINCWSICIMHDTRVSMRG